MQLGSSHPRSSLALVALTCLWLCVGASAQPGPAPAPNPGSAPATTTATAAPGRQSGDIWLTTSRAGELARSQIARAVDGTYIAVRDNSVPGQSTADTAVFWRRLDPAGNPIGAETPLGRGTAPGVTTFSDGTFLVTWLAPLPATFSLNVAVTGQLFDNSGRPTGTPMSLGVTGSYARPTALSDGTFVLATFGHFSRVNGPSGFLRAYNRSGAEVGLVAELHEDPCGIQGPPAVSALATGGFAVAWPYACVSAPQVRMRVYSAIGSLGASSRMSVGTQGETARVGLATLTNGNLALQWTLGTSAIREVRTLVVAPASLPQSPAGATLVPIQPGRTPGEVQALADGGFVIPWSAVNSSEARVPVSRFSNSGEPL